MKKFALAGVAMLAFAAGPALAQVGGGPAPGGGPPGGAGNPGGAAERIGPPDRDAGNAQEAMDRQVDLGRKPARGADRAQAYRQRLEEFGTRTAGQRSEALALSEAARSGQPLLQSAQEIRDKLAQDMEDWRKTFKIDKAAYEGLRNEIIVDVNQLTAKQWADRRVQWFEVRDAWIAQEMAQTQTQAGGD